MPPLTRCLRIVLTRFCLFFALVAGLSDDVSGQAYRNGKFTLRAIDFDTREPLAVRMHVKDQRGKTVKRPGMVYWHDHFVFDGEITLDMRPGLYTFEVERGPEYRVIQGNFQIGKDAEDTKTIEMRRFVSLSKQGWWSGDLHIHRPLQEIELLMKAEDLHIGPVITWWNDQNWWKDHEAPTDLLVKFDTNRFYHVMGGEDEREGGALLYFNRTRSLPIQNLAREYPSPAKFLKQADEEDGVHIDIEKPFWWDMPVWIASGRTDSIGLANNHLFRDGGLHNEAWGKPRDKVAYPGNQGNGRWSQNIYYHLLNCGLRIPPSAGSASGVLANPVGYNRVYVHCGSELTWDKWWQGLRDGRVIVTNGPLLLPTVEGQLPGHVFTAGTDQQLALQINLQLFLRDKVDYLEVVQDGKVVHEVRLDQYAKAGGKLPLLKFDRSGWFLVRAVTTHKPSYRFGTTGPYYVQIGDAPRISRTSAQFFVDWVYERARRIEVKDPEQRAEVLKYHRAARDFWEDLLSRANAE